MDNGILHICYYLAVSMRVFENIVFDLFLARKITYDVCHDCRVPNLGVKIPLPDSILSKCS